MGYYVRLMNHGDLEQVTEIDQEAFPTMWPPANYERELKTSLAHYIVAYEADSAAEGLRRKTRKTNNQRIIGFAGMWMIADESHITNIAVRESYRRKGIGELLFIAMIEMALALGARFITLEVRTSNTTAQGLYHKYQFNQVHVRKGYYTDNRENALVMVTEDITKDEFQERFQHMKQAHARKWGIDSYRAAR